MVSDRCITSALILLIAVIKGSTGCLVWTDWAPCQLTTGTCTSSGYMYGWTIRYQCHDDDNECVNSQVVSCQVPCTDHCGSMRLGSIRYNDDCTSCQCIYGGWLYCYNDFCPVWSAGGEINCKTQGHCVTTCPVGAPLLNEFNETVVCAIPGDFNTNLYHNVEVTPCPNGYSCHSTDDTAIANVSVCCPGNHIGSSSEPPTPAICIQVPNDGEVCVDNDLFTIFRKPSLNWIDAEQFCDVMYPEQISNLAVVSTKALRLSLTSYIKSDTTLSFGRIGRGYWVGCNDIENEGHFIWADGTEVDDQNWEKRQPNNNNGQHCCQMWQHPKNKPRFKLDDETCSKKKGYICQIKNGCSE